MAGEIRISTDEVANAASVLENLNKKLKNTLEDGQARVKALNAVWEGEAATQTVSTFDAFASQYFDVYYELIAKYVAFLRENVERGYFITEKENVNYADSFR